jgi:regulator of protease activity HflC (stomatin/prohibitin superfamily)
MLPVNSEYQQELYLNPNIPQERKYHTWDGCWMILINFAIMAGGIAITIALPVADMVWGLAIGIPMFIVSFIFWFGFFSLDPNTCGVVTFCGSYKGTVKESGLFWINPFAGVTKVSLKANNLNGQMIKVNDKSGSPIEIALVVVWRVKETSKALFGVENYFDFVRIQSEAALRNLAYSYNYDKLEEHEICLREGHEQITKHLIEQLNTKFEKSGICVDDAKVTHLAYAPEIAGAMLRKQQAQATIAAREKIIQGAVSIVESALETLKNRNICEFTPESKTKLVSNLLVMLSSESHVQPVLNTGSS